MNTLILLAKCIWLAIAVVVGFVGLCIVIVATFTWLVQSAEELVETIRESRDG